MWTLVEDDLGQVGDSEKGEKDRLNHCLEYQPCRSDCHQCRRKYTIPGLMKYSVYDVSVCAHTAAGFGNPVLVSRQRTKSDNPLQPEVLDQSNATHDSIEIVWKKPIHTYGILERYEVTWWPKQIPSVTKGAVNVSSSTLTAIIPQLMFSMDYVISVRGFTVDAIGGGENSTITGTTDKLIISKDSDPVFATFSDEHLTKYTFPMKLVYVPDTFGTVDFYQVIVCAMEGSQLPNESSATLIPDDRITRSSFGNPVEFTDKIVGTVLACYIAAEFDDIFSLPYNESFVVGDGKIYKREGIGVNKFENAEVKAGTTYTAFQRTWISTGSPRARRATNSDGRVSLSGAWIQPKKTNDEDPDPVPVGAIVAGVLIPLVIVGAIGYFVYRRRLKRGDDDDSNLENPQPLVPVNPAPYRRGEPVPINFFEQRVHLLKQDSGLKYEEEYEDLDPEEEPRMEHGRSNTDKNRWRDIIPFDHSRVTLKHIPGVYGSDYVNANYIDGFVKRREYIATQGPIPNTVQDFWRMVWEHNSTVIVMLTNVIECDRKKCEQYWPDQGSVTFGPMSVRLINEIVLADHTVRYLGLLHVEESDAEMMVQQFHYTAWPDKGIPEDFTSLLSFIKKSSTANSRNKAPMIVHCSAGVGRTGTYITLDAQLKRMAEKENLNIFDYVRSLRHSRRLMVQTEGQYQFIHDVLLDRINNGDTETEFKYLSDYTRRLKYRNPETDSSGMESEFNRLNPIHITGDMFSYANLACNKSKNRYANVLPFDKTRVSLQMVPGVDGSDYINANFMGGYLVQNEYIATQAPIPDTIVDFWRMVWEYNCCTIVMLSREMEGGRVRVLRYWPNKAPTPIGEIIMEMTSEVTYSDYVLREIKISHSKIGASRVVRHYQFTAWPDTGVPDTGTGLVDLIGQVQRWQHQNNVNSSVFNPSVIHCGAGCGRTGVFITLSIVIERLKAEGVVDVFNTVRGLRRNRPAMVQSLEQYEFVYFVLQEYLDSFEQYGNLS